MEFPETILKRYKDYGFDEVEIYNVSGRIVNTSVSADRIKELNVVDTLVYSLRASSGRKVGSMAIRGHPLNPDDIMRKLKGIVRASPEDPEWPGFPPDYGINKGAICYDNKIADLIETESAILEVLNNLLGETKRRALEAGATDVTIVNASWSLGTVKYSVFNSNGINHSSPCTLNNLVIQVKANTTRGLSDWTINLINRRADYKELFETINREAPLATLFGGSKPVKSGKYNVVLYSSVFAGLLSDVLMPAFSALNVLKKRSPLGDKLQQAVFSERITITEVPTINLERGTRPFDDEGVPTTSKTLVERGILKNFLHNFYTHRKFNASSWGNGFRRTPETSPIPMPTNITLRGESGNLDEFVREMRRGLVIYDAIGHWMSNPVTGHVKATVTHGLLVEQGMIAQAVKGVIIVGNIYKWLNEFLEGVGSDVKINGGVATPSVLISNVDVGGE